VYIYAILLQYADANTYVLSIITYNIRTDAKKLEANKPLNS